jgi:hypothetical protein
MTGIAPCYPSSVKSGKVNRDRLIEIVPGKAFILFVSSLKQDNIPGFQPDLTKEGLARYETSTENKAFQIRRIMSAVPSPSPSTQRSKSGI